ncbi:MAG: tRNA uridine-5-carboxymethylaminomethyl(34) synthesis GTPase MnmE [Bacteroidales bacterium]|nr:tRNA uridine-5-carboxymethylaminomethyl(34) synthesis GTPase MnmE [Bacteroidales bacterium]
MNSLENPTICAISTPAGSGAVALIRMSGSQSLPILNQIFRSKTQKKDFQEIPRKIYFGEVVDEQNVIIDEVLVWYLAAPNSYTGEDMVGISCHGSPFIQKTIVELLIRKGCKMADGGEFTMRAFLNGKMDLVQAESVADLIASQSRTSHALAMKNLRGGFSQKIQQLREQLLRLASLLELELDFSEEDVEFANRKELEQLIDTLKSEIKTLVDSFALGNVFKNGIPVAIIGKPNVGKSTLLNALMNEELAIVSDIPGTTRDTIEDRLNINGFTFRFMDTAGIRASDDTLENIGINRTYRAVEQSFIVLYIVDTPETSIEEILNDIDYLKKNHHAENKEFIVIGNKTDLLVTLPSHFQKWNDLNPIFISAKRKENINLITERLSEIATKSEMGDQTLISNARHYEAMSCAYEALLQVEQSFQNNLPTDLIASDLRMVLYRLGSITGEVSSEEILSSIFSKFCIGK